MSRAIFLMIASMVGAAIAWAIREPSAPRVYDPRLWGQWELGTGVALGALIGLFLGLASGKMQGSRAHLIRNCVGGLALGAMSGGIGISLGGALYQAGARFPVIGEVFRISGWAIMGSLIGFGLGASNLSKKRAFYGTIGGLLGGLLGGAAFVLVGIATAPVVTSIEQARESGTFSRAVGFTILGAAIGLMIGVVEAAAKQAWVRLVLGRNEGKEWPIFDDQFTLGRSETAHAPLTGDPNLMPVHAVIQKSGREYYLSAVDPVSSIILNGQPIKQAQIVSGDTFQLGQHSLVFLTRGGRMQRVATPQPHVQPVEFTAPVASTGGQGVVAQTQHSLPTMMAPGPAPMTSNPTVSRTSAMVLVAMNGPIAGQRFPLLSTVELGRETGPIPLSFDQMASRRHVLIDPKPDSLTFSDLGSKNGTLLNGVLLKSGTMRPGDLLQVGSTTFRLETA